MAERSARNQMGGGKTHTIWTKGSAKSRHRSEDPGQTDYSGPKRPKSGLYRCNIRWIIESLPQPSGPPEIPAQTARPGHKLAPAGAHSTFKDLDGAAIFDLQRRWRALTPDRRAYIEKIVERRYTKLRFWLYEHSSSPRSEIDDLLRFKVLKHPAVQKRIQELATRPVDPHVATAAARGQANVLKRISKGGAR